MKKGLLFLALLISTAAFAATTPAPTAPSAVQPPAAANSPPPDAVATTTLKPTDTTPLKLDNSTPGATSAIVPSFVGVYKCKGIDPYLNDKTYTGTVTVTQQNTVYRLEMDYDTGEKAIGTGGLYDQHLLSVVFQDTTDPKHVGLEQYHFTDDYKTMSGYWVYLGNDKLGKEICDKQ